MNAVAISNNDMVYLHWHVDGKIPDCLGFSVLRHEAGSPQPPQPLPAMVGFSSDTQAGKQAAERLAYPKVCMEGLVRSARRHLLVRDRADDRYARQP